MAYEQREGSGALFKNAKKEKENQPDYQGDCKVGGVKYRLSAWIKEGAKGKWMSLSIQVDDGKKDGAKGSDTPF